MKNKYVFVIIAIFALIGLVNAQIIIDGVNERIFGVKQVNNVTYAQNYATLYDAINASKTMSYGTVIAVGNYTFSSLITVPSDITLDFRAANLTWTGASGGGTKMFDVSGKHITILSGESCSNGADYHMWLSGKDITVIGGNFSCQVAGSGLFRVTGSNIRISGVYADGSNLGIGINGLDGAHDVLIHDNIFMNFADNAIDFGTSGAGTEISNIVERNNLINGGGGGGISFYSNVKNSSAIGNVISNKGSRCFRISNQGFGTPVNIELKSNTCLNNTFAAFWLQGSKDVDISGNTVRSELAPSEANVLLDSALNSNITISDNYFRMSKQNTHIQIRANAGFAQNLTISNNEIRGGAAGISINKVNYSDFSNNAIWDQFFYGFEVISSINNTFSSNRIFRADNDAIHESGVSTNNVYVGTIIRETATCPVLAGASVKYSTFCNGVFTP